MAIERFAKQIGLDSAQQAQLPLKQLKALEGKIQGVFTSACKSLGQAIDKIDTSKLSFKNRTRDTNPEKSRETPSASTKAQMRTQADLDRAIKTATKEVVFLEKQATKPGIDTHTQQELVQLAVEAKGRLHQLKDIKKHYEAQLQKNIVLDDRYHISNESLLKVITVAAHQGIITRGTSELPGSFGMAATTTIRDNGREFRVMVEMDTKGELLIRVLMDKIAEGAEGVVSKTRQYEEKRTQEVIKEPKTQAASDSEEDEVGEEISKPDIRREAKLMAKAKNGVETGIKVRHVMGGGDVGFMDHRSGGDMTKAAAARRAATLLLEIPPDQINSPHSETSWKMSDERKDELAGELTQMAMNQTGTVRGKAKQQLLDVFVSEIGKTLLSEKTIETGEKDKDEKPIKISLFDVLEKQLTPEAVHKLVQEKGQEGAKNELEALFAHAIEEVVQKLPSAHETYDTRELFTAITSEIELGHKNGIIHRDLKPGNVLHSSDKETHVGSKPTLADYGMAVDLSEVRQKLGVPEGFTLGRRQDRLEVQSLIKTLHPFEDGKKVHIANKDIAQRLVSAGILQKSKENPHTFIIVDKKNLEKLYNHLEIVNCDKFKIFLPPGTNLYNFNPYFELAGEYLKRGDIESYENILKKLDEIAGAMTFYELTTGERMPSDFISMGLTCVRLSDEDLAQARSKLEAAGQPPEVVDKIMQMMTPGPQVDVSALQNECKDNPLPTYPSGLALLDQATSSLLEKVPGLNVSDARKQLTALVSEKKPGTHVLTIGGQKVRIVVVTKKDGQLDLLYRSENHFAKGAGGQVYKGVSLTSGQSFAIKSPIVIDGDIDPISQEAIKYEGRLFAELQKDGERPGILHAELQGDDLVMDFYELGDYQKQISIQSSARFFCCDDLSALDEKIEEKYLLIEDQLKKATSREERQAILSSIMSDVDIENFKVLVGESTIQNFRRGLVQVGNEEKLEDLLKKLQPLFGEFASKVANVMREKAKPSDLSQEMRFCAELTAAMQHMHSCEIFHADIKPLNELWDGKNCVLSDLGDSKNLADIAKEMRPNLGIKNKSERLQMIDLLVAIENNDTDLIKLHIEKNKAQYDKLFELGVLEKTKKGFRVDTNKFRDLKRFLTQTDTPANTGGTMGYRNPIYQDAAREYFLCGNTESMRLALIANDMCARAIANYVHLTGATLPTQMEQGVLLGNLGKPQNDAQGLTYYDRMEANLRAKGVPEEACSILRKMAEPIILDPNNLPDPFPLPVTDQELDRLQSLLGSPAESKGYTQTR